MENFSGFSCLSSLSGESTIAAVASPAGRGAIAVIRLSGKDCFSILDKVFFSKDGRPAAGRPPRELRFGKLYALRGEKKNLLDEGMCVVFPSPHSYTGEDSAEIYCHGGPVVTHSILTALLEAGAEMASGGEFTRRAWMNGKMSLTAAEAVEEIIDARNPLLASCAAEALSGSFGRRVSSLRERLLTAAAHYAAWMDFTDEGVEPPEEKEVSSLLEDAAEELTRMKEACLAGNSLREGIACAIVGRTNSGKSTLLNALTGKEKSIVTSYAGTTRDVVEESRVLHGKLYHFMDTAGFRETEDPVEKIGIQRSRDCLKKAEICLLLFDASESPEEEDRIACEAVLREKKQRENQGTGTELRVIRLFNKTDLLPEGLPSEEKRKEWESLVPGESLYISAKAGSGLEELEALLAAGEETGGKEAIVNLRHRDLILRAHRVLTETEEDRKAGITPDCIWSGLMSAASLLGELTGEETTEDMIDKIFANFCVGK